MSVNNGNGGLAKLIAGAILTAAFGILGAAQVWNHSEIVAQGQAIAALQQWKADQEKH